MSSGRHRTTRPGSPTLVTGLVLTAIGLLVGASAATAAPGPQPAPTIDPSPVSTAATTFSFSGGTCDGTGGSGWRVQTFVVDDGVDVSTLTFESGVASDQVGTDRDATDGTIRAPLFKGSAPGTGFLPAASPAGLINPSDLSGFSFGDAGWTLTDGTYQIGYVCLDELSAMEQWWALTVTIDADASSGSFLTVGGTVVTTSTTTSTTVAGGSTTSTTAGGGSTSTTTGGATTTTASVAVTTTSAAGAFSTTTTQGAGVLGGGTSQGTGSGSLARTGQGLALAGVGLVLLYVGRVAYLLARPRSATGR